MNHSPKTYLSLFSGAGGGDLAAQYYTGWQAVAYVEYDEYPAAVLAQRVADGWLSPAPVHNMKVSEFNAAHAFEGMADVVTGGFPCQPFSVAGQQAAESDLRNAWPETLDCLRIVRPRYALLENVRGLTNLPYFAKILADLATLGYAVNWRILSAAEVGATHRRDRVWIVAVRDDLPTPKESNPTAVLNNGEWVTAVRSFFDPPAVLEKCPKAGMVRGDALYARKDWARPLPRQIVAMWPTPNTMDNLPPRSAESLHHELTVRWPGRSQAANLRDAVTGAWPTPTVHDEKAYHPAELTRNSPPLMAMVQLWPSPNAGLFNDSEAPADFLARRETSGAGIPLAVAARMWPSPNTPSQGGRAEDVESLEQRGNTFYRPSGAKATLHLETAVTLCPTVTLNGNHNRKGASATSGDGLATAVIDNELWRTPNSAVVDAKRGTIKLRGRAAKDPQVGLADQVKSFAGRQWEEVGVAGQAVKTTAPKLMLNPRWVGALMGWPLDWEQPTPLAELIWPAAYGMHPAPPGPAQYDWEPPRVALPDPFRRVSLRALGNGQVPQSAAVAWDLLTSDVLASEVSTL